MPDLLGNPNLEYGAVITIGGFITLVAGMIVWGVVAWCGRRLQGR